MPAKKEDRRIGRTRRLLQDALIDLMVEKGYESLTVKDIVDRANVGRSTFYAHYPDVRELLLSRLRELEAFLAEQHRAAAASSAEPTERIFGYSRAVFEHAASHSRIWRAIVGREGGTIVINELHRMLLNLIRGEVRSLLPRRGRPTIPADVVSEYAVSALQGLLVWWLDDGMRYPAAEIDRMFRALTAPGMIAAMRPSAAGRAG